MFLLSGFLFNISVLCNIAFIIFVLFFERRESSRRMGWLLALIFLPFVGVILYFFFSGHFFTKNRRMDKAKALIKDILAPHLKKQLDFLNAFDTSTKKSEKTPLFSYKSLIEMNINYSNSLLTFEPALTLFLWGQDKFKSLCRDLENATQTINMEYFIFRDDKIGTKIMDILCKKAKQGIQVKLLYDDFGCIKTKSGFFEQLNKSGGKARSFFPIRQGFLFSLNFRNHRKIVVIDGKIAYTGGINIGDEYANQHKTKKILWRDTAIRFEGTSVQMMQLVFLTDWYSANYNDHTLDDPNEAQKYFPQVDLEHLSQAITEKSSQALSGLFTSNTLIPVQIVSSGPNEFQHAEIKDALIRMIMSAKKSVYIQTPYFTPDESFYTVLKIAAFSGIDVRIMVPDQWDKFYVRAAAFEYIREMLDFGIRFYHYPGFIHAKTITVDGQFVSIGTTNIDSRSFVLHFEVNAFIYDSKFAQKYEQIFLDDQTKCRAAVKKWFDSRFILQRAWWGFCKLFSPLM